jgi:hypothetical protein
MYWSPDSLDWPNSSTPHEMVELVEVLGGDIGHHRFGLWQDHPAPVLAGLLRHGLEHARQWHAHGNGLFAVHEAMKPAYWDKTDGLSFGGILINLAPIELDAYAGAARFAWARHGKAVAGLLEHGAGQHEPLFRYRGGPEPLDTLPARTIRFGHLFAERYERQAAAAGQTFAAVLEQRWPGAAAFWTELDRAGLPAHRASGS